MPLRPSTESAGSAVDAVAQRRFARAAANAELARPLFINQAALRSEGLLPEEVAEGYLAEQYRSIKRPILAKAQAPEAAGGARPQLLMVGGALPGDGKTFTSVNLALSIAMERDFRVLLVDADIAKAHVSRAFGVIKQPGLLDALLDASLDVESLILSTSVPGFSILPVGCPHESATELLASARMIAITSRLIECDPARIVVFDSAPLLLSSETRALVNVVGQIVIVVHAGVTPQSAVREALTLVPPDRLAGLVLNRSTTDGLDYYGYGYGYGYNYKYRRDSSQEGRSADDDRAGPKDRAR
jgi:protein-tyrosine kinase